MFRVEYCTFPLFTIQLLGTFPTRLRTIFSSSFVSPIQPHQHHWLAVASSAVTPPCYPSLPATACSCRSCFHHTSYHSSAIAHSHSPTALSPPIVLPCPDSSPTTTVPSPTSYYPPCTSTMIHSFIQPGKHNRNTKHTYLNNILLVGLHVGAVWKSVMRTPDSASHPIFGVEISEPYGDVSENPRSSATIMRKLGRLRGSEIGGGDGGVIVWVRKVEKVLLLWVAG